MKYKIVPFVASLVQKNVTGQAAAEQLQALIDQHSVNGWRYVRLESVTTWVAPDQGCFGLGAKPGFTTSRQMIVFEMD